MQEVEEKKQHTKWPPPAHRFPSSPRAHVPTCLVATSSKPELFSEGRVERHDKFCARGGLRGACQVVVRNNLAWQLITVWNTEITFVGLLLREDNITFTVRRVGVELS